MSRVDLAAPVWRPIVHHDLALQRVAAWSVVSPGIEARDLGLGRASDGAMQAWVLRTGDAAAPLTGVAAASGPSLRMLYVLRGSVRLISTNGGSTELVAGDCAHQVALGQLHRIELSAHTEVFDMAVAASPAVDGRSFALESPQVAAQLFVNRDVAGSYIKGDGPRSYFLYRDLGLAAATARRIHVHVLKATAPSPAGGTGFHTHSMCQLFYVFDGWADVQAGGHEDVRMGSGDAMCVAAGTPHNVPAFSDNYAIIEVCIPADYDTVDA